MKKHLKIAVAVIVFAVVIAVGTVIALGLGDPAVTVEKYNLTFKDTVYLTYAVRFDNLPSGAEKGILVWDEPQSEYTVNASGYTKITNHSGTVNFGNGTCYIYDYKGIAAKEMTDSVYIVGYIKDGDNYTYSELSKFGVLHYAYNKLGYTGEGTTNAKFAELLQSLLQYGTEAQKYFGYNVGNLATDKYYLLELDGGKLDDLSTFGLYKEGIELNVTAPATKDGAGFAAWVASDGEYLSFEPSFTYTVQGANEKLTALYSKTNLNLVLNGGALAAGDVTEYDPAADTALPIPTKANSVFEGWYTSQSFDVGTRVEKIPAGTSGVVTIFARWSTTLVDNDFESSNIDVNHGTASHGGVSVNANKVGSAAKTETDANNNKYLKMSVEAEDAIVSASSSTYNLTHFNEQSISIQLDLAKIGGVDLLRTNINIATSGSAYGQLAIATVNPTTGNVSLVGSSKVIATVGEEFVTLRLVVDFAAGDGIAYDADGNELDRVKLAVPTNNKGNPRPASLAEWQKVATNYLLYCYMKNSSYSTTGTVASIAYDDIFIADGNSFRNDEPTNIVYVTNGGTLQEGASSYMPGVGLPSLPTPKREGYVFDGWYSEYPPSVLSRPTSSVSAQAAGTVTLFAKWNLFKMDYEGYTVDAGDGQTVTDGDGNTVTNPGKKVVGGINHATVGKIGSYMRTKTEDGNTYLEWHNGTGYDSFVQADTVAEIVGKIGVDKTYTMSVDLAKLDGTDAFKTSFTVCSGSRRIPLFNVTAAGEVYLGSTKDVLITTLTSSFKTVTVTLDLDTGALYSANESKRLLSTEAVLPSGFDTFADFLAAADRLFSFRLSSYTEGTILLDNIEIYAESFNVFVTADEEDQESRTEELKEEISRFEYSSEHTVGEHTSMEIGVFEPDARPVAGEHPRLMLNAGTLEAIRAAFALPENSDYANGLVNAAGRVTDGILPEAYEHTSGRKGVHNYDGNILYSLEAKALMYLITGDEVYGYEAVLGIKNFMNTLDIRWIYSDQCREFGSVMFVAAEIYDWCYSLLTEKDKEDIMLGVEYLVCRAETEKISEYSGTHTTAMEVGFPPSGQGAISGHGSEAQILRDYLAAAIAFYDEDPTWYDYIAGRVYNEFVAFRNLYYTSTGIYPQGSGNYANHRFRFDLFSAWMLSEMPGGYNPYSSDMAKVMVSFAAHERPDGRMFPTGDGSAVPTGAQNSFISGALFGNKTLYSVGFSEMSLGVGAGSMTAAQFIIFASKNPGHSETQYDGIPVILHNGGFVGQIVSRERWGDADAAAVFMKIGERSTANHEHADSGTFQIYYKGLFTGDSGVYTAYGSAHHVYYHRATVAHNGLLIYDPSSYDGTLAADGTPKNVAAYWYSGSQRKLGETSSIETWKTSEKYNTGTVLGVKYAYRDEAKTEADYAYIAGDITASYPVGTAECVERRMLTVYTGDESVPMYLFVYDDVSALDASYEKRFILHAGAEPVLDEVGRTVTVTEGEGKLVLTSLIGADRMDALGGEGKTFLINGVNCTPANGSAGGEWGRVEIVTEGGEKHSKLLNVLYVTGAENSELPSPELLAAENVCAARLGNTVAVFLPAKSYVCEEFSVDALGEGEVRYFVSGELVGTWSVSVDGVKVTDVVIPEGEGVVEFTAPAGTAVFTPSEDVPEVMIKYNTFGGTMEGDDVDCSSVGDTVKLRTDVTRGEDEFVGWYTSPDFKDSELVTELTPASAGIITVYAKYKTVAISEDYESRDFAFGESNLTVDEILYVGKDKTGSWFEVLTDESTGNKYLSVSRTEKDMQIDSRVEVSSFAASYDTVITYEVDLALSGDKTPLGSSFMLRESTTSQRVTLFGTGTDGAVTFGGQTLFRLGSEFKTVIVSVDFANGLIYAYAKDGTELATVEFTVPEASEAQSTLEWMSKLAFTFNWWMGSGEELLIDNVKVYTGAYLA